MVGTRAKMPVELDNKVGASTQLLPFQRKVELVTVPLKGVVLSIQRVEVPVLDKICPGSPGRPSASTKEPLMVVVALLVTGPLLVTLLLVVKAPLMVVVAKVVVPITLRVLLTVRFWTEIAFWLMLMEEKSKVMVFPPEMVRVMVLLLLKAELLNIWLSLDGSSVQTTPPVL